MQTIAKFEKVSLQQFELDAAQATSANLQESYEAIVLPKRKTVGSAGYDFHAPFSFALNAGESIVIASGVRVQITPGWWLGILPRSGHGFRYRIQLDNTLGVIDSDYYGAENEGHILIKLTNDSKTGKTLEIEAGTGFAQGIFLPYGIAAGDQASEARSGGFGSTDPVKREQ